MCRLQILAPDASGRHLLTHSQLTRSSVRAKNQLSRVVRRELGRNPPYVERLAERRMENVKDPQATALSSHGSTGIRCALPVWRTNFSKASNNRSPTFPNMPVRMA